MFLFLSFFVLFISMKCVVIISYLCCYNYCCYCCYYILFPNGHEMEGVDEPQASHGICSTVVSTRTARHALERVNRLLNEL